MTTVKALKVAFLASVLSMTAIIPGQAETRLTCYATIHDECYPPGGEPQCSSEDYNQWLTDFCDSQSADGGGRPPAAPSNLKIIKSNPGTFKMLQQKLGR